MTNVIKQGQSDSDTSPKVKRSDGQVWKLTRHSNCMLS